MSFPVQLCLTNTGNTSLGPIFYAYSNLDSYTTPFDTNVLLSNIVGDSCPYTLTEVPDGTTTLLLKNISNGCCVYMDVSENLDLCVICDLGFDDYSTSTVGLISVGDLTGSCDNSITDYVVNWYGPNSSTNIQFTSGKGSQFSYNYPHPLTGTSSVLVPPGNYTPEIETVILNGTTLQENFGVLSDCFVPIDVDGLNCSNGSSTNPYYEHEIIFDTTTQTESLPTLSTDFYLSSNTKYVAFAFGAYSLSLRQTLTIIYSGSNYDNPLILENFEIGSTSGNIGPNDFPKQLRTNKFFQKVLCLTGLTYAEGDKLIFEIQTETNNQQTLGLYIKCLETFNCEKCLDQKTPFKIIQSSITGITGSCNTIDIEFKISGCTFEEIESSDLITYMTSYVTGIQSDLGKGSNISTESTGTQYNFTGLSHSFSSCTLNDFNPDNSACDSGGSTINLRSWRPNSTTRIIELEFSGLTDYQSYINTYEIVMGYSGSSNPQSIDYYRYMRLSIPQPNGSAPCSSTTPRFDFLLHPSTTNKYSLAIPPSAGILSLTATTISQELVTDECLNCDTYIASIVPLINNTITGSSFDVTGTTTVSSRYSQPFNLVRGVLTAITSPISSEIIGYTYITDYSNITYVASGDPLINVTSMSAKTCDLGINMKPTNSFGSAGYPLHYQNSFVYKVELTNPSDRRDFRISASTITNGAYVNFPNFNIDYDAWVYGISAGTVYHTNTTYLI